MPKNNRYTDIIKSLFRLPKGNLEAAPMEASPPLFAPGDFENIPDKRAFLDAMPLGSTVTWQGNPYEVVVPPMREDMPPDMLAVAVEMRKRNRPESLKPIKR